MEKYGVERDTYEVVIPKLGKQDDFQVKGSGLTFDEAIKLQESHPHSIIKPEK